MSLFRKNEEYPELPAGNYDLVLRCSICNGEQVLCMKDKATGALRDLYMRTDQKDLDGFCKANNVKPATIKRVY